MNVAEIEAAAKRLSGRARRTPLLRSRSLDRIAGRRVLVKAECLQRTGSFKFRGGWSAVSAPSPEPRPKGVIAFSSGNHAQGVAVAAPRDLGHERHARERPEAEDRRHPRAGGRSGAVRPGERREP